MVITEYVALVSSKKQKIHICSYDKRKKNSLFVNECANNNCVAMH